VRITFDPIKRNAAFADRGLDFADAVEVFAGPTFSFVDDRFDYGEVRIVTVGLLAGRMVIVIWTGDDHERRVISMRKANERERTRYRQRLG
jgi:uncharacterized DUF497 family protein